jgi:hemerythrin
MTVFEWKAEYEVGEEHVDIQHREWFLRVQRLFEGLEGGLTEPQVVELLEFALDYTNRHFALEEVMLRAARYPGLEEHRSEHRALSARVNSWLEAARQGNPKAPWEAAQFLAQWIKHHIKTRDFAYVPWIKGERPETEATSKPAAK